MNSVASVILLLSPDQSKEYSKPSCGRSGMLTTFCWYLPAALPYLRPPYNQRLDGIFMQSEAHGLNSAFSCQAAVAAASSRMQESADFFLFFMCCQLLQAGKQAGQTCCRQLHDVQRPRGSDLPCSPPTHQTTPADPAHSDCMRSPALLHAHAAA